MILNRKILSGLILSGLTLGIANAADLVQMDIRKTSENSVDVTFYTTETSGAPLVTRKSNNKYVVLMPNVAGKNAGTPDLSSVRDIIYNVDIKNVDDGLNGYTKVTFITTKPVNINTSIKKTAPLTQEETEARSLIAQAKTHPQQTVAPVEPKKEVQATKVTSSTGISNSAAQTEPKAEKPAVQPKKEVQEVKKTTVNQTPTQTKVSKAIPTEQKHSENTIVSQKPTEEIVSITSETENLNVNDLDKIEKVAKHNEHKSGNKSVFALFLFPILAIFMIAKFLKNYVQKSNALSSSFNENLQTKPYVQENYNNIIEDEELSWQEKYQKYVEETSATQNKNEPKDYTFKFISTPEKTKEIISSSSEIDKADAGAIESVQNSDAGKIPAKQISSTTKKSEPKTLPFIKNTSPKFIPAKNKTDDRIKTINQLNSNVSLKKFSDFEEFKFISKVEDYNKDIGNLDKKRLELENTLTKTPEIYQKKSIDISNIPSDKVVSEDTAIQRQLSNSTLKSFANPLSLDMTRRNHNQNETIQPTGLNETQHVNLEENKLNFSERNLSDANLKLNEMKAKRHSRMSTNAIKQMEDEQKYVVSSVDEYFNLLDSDKTTQETSLSQKVAESLAKVKPSMKMNNTHAKARMDNPISGKTSKDYMSGLVVKQSFNIDENKGFYIVSLDGSNALIGRVGSEIFVLEKFNNEPGKMQVRLDSENVYIVKIGSYKALIDVSDTKMGVLIQL